MKVFEAAKKAGFLKTHSALAISCEVAGAATIESEMRLVKEAVVRWKQRQGRKCAELMLVITADESQHEKIAKYVDWALSKDVFLSEFVPTLNVQVQLLNLQGAITEQFNHVPEVR
jgi:hypothetical protein